VQRLKTLRSISPTGRSDMAIGHVYLIGPIKPHKDWTSGTGTWPFKIGVSKSNKGVAKRLSTLNTGNWVQLGIEYISPQIPEPYDVELYLHKNYSKRKIKGEWFELSYAEVNYIKDLLDKEADETIDSMRERGAHIREWGDNHVLW